MTKQYNKKINVNGEYTPCYGWTSVLDVKTDLKFAENYIKYNTIISKYFSALPCKSYHMTLYNIWSNGRRLLPHQQRCLKMYNEKDLKEYAKEYNNFFNPMKSMNELLYKLYYTVDKMSEYKELNIGVKSLVYTGNNIQIQLEMKGESVEKLNSIRKKMIDICEVDDNLCIFHITLGYQYKVINQNDVDILMRELNTLNLLLNDYVITVGRPRICSFKDMTSFDDFEKSLENITPIPDDIISYKCVF